MNISKDFHSEVIEIEEIISFNVDLLRSQPYWKKYVRMEKKQLYDEELYEDEELDAVCIDWHRAIMGGRFSRKQIDKYATDSEQVCWHLYRGESDKWTENMRVLRLSSTKNTEVLENILGEIDLRWLGIIENQNHNPFQSRKREVWERMVSKVEEKRQKLLVEMLESDDLTPVMKKFVRDRLDN